jgi:hypothetical protein
MDDQLFGMKSDNPGDADRLLEGLVECAARQQGCLVVDVHEYVFDAALFPGWAATYRRLLAQLAQRGDFWLATPAEIARHWRARYDRLLAESSGLSLGLALAEAA